MAKFYRIVVLGAQNVGKTTLINSFFNNEFTEEYSPTIEDTYSVADRALENQYFIDIVDTGGIDIFANVRDHWLQEGKTLILVYSVSCRDSFLALDGIRTELMKLGLDDTPVVVVGNKCDLEPRAVRAEEGSVFSKSFMDSFFVEASAKTKTNVQVIFHHAIQRIGEKVLEGMSDAAKRKHNCLLF